MTTAVVVVGCGSVVTAAAATSTVVVDTSTLDDVVTATCLAAGAGGLTRGRKATIAASTIAIASADIAAIAGHRRGAVRDSAITVEYAAVGAAPACCSSA